MSELAPGTETVNDSETGTETATETGTGTGTGTQTGTGSTSVINQAVDSVAYLIRALELFSPITRGALGTGNGLACEVGASGAEEVYLDKNQYIILDLTINGKHTNLLTLSDDMNKIHENLTMLKS